MLKWIVRQARQSIMYGKASSLDPCKFIPQCNGRTDNSYKEVRTHLMIFMIPTLCVCLSKCSSMHPYNRLIPSVRLTFGPLVKLWLKMRTYWLYPRVLVHHLWAVSASLLLPSRTQLMLAWIQPCFSSFGYQNIFQFSGLFTCTLVASQFIQIPIFVALGKV